MLESQKRKSVDTVCFFQLAYYYKQVRIELNILYSGMDKKIPFGVKILKKAVFLKMVEDWSTALDLDIFIHQHYFKYFPRFIIDIQKSFIINIIKYTIMKRFPLLLSQSSEQDVLSLSSKIKQAYALININVIMKLDSCFYFLSVFLTKIISQFLSDLFNDIDIDKQLESQLYIILVFVIIGLEVAPKTYQINHKKIIYQKYLNKGSPKSICRLESIENLHQKRSSSKMTPHKAVRKMAVERKWTNVSCREEPTITPLDEFKQNLKENLIVKALPKLAKKKIKGCDFDFNADCHIAEMKGDQKKYKFLRETQLISMPNQQFIKANQNSTSFEFFFKTQKQSNHNLQRNVKISHRHQLLLKNRNLRSQHYSKSAMQTPQSFKEQADDDKMNRNWKNVVKEIRQQSFQTNKINSFIKTSKDFAPEYQRNRKVETIRTSSGVLQRKAEIECSERQFMLLPKTTNFGSYWIHQKEQPFNNTKKETKTQNDFHRTEPHKLRKERNVFQRSCEKRNQQAHSSMFNIMAGMNFHI